MKCINTNLIVIAVGLTALLFLGACGKQVIKNDGLKIILSKDGTITDLKPGVNENYSLNAFTRLDKCKQIVATMKKKVPDGVEYSRMLEDSIGNRCRVVDRFLSDTDGLVWEIEIHGDGNPWSTPIETVFNYPKTQNSLFWTSWTAMSESADKWEDPFEMKPFNDLVLTYGGKDIFDRNSFVLPLFSICEKDKNCGFTIAESPRDTILDMQLITSADGKVVFRRENHRISKDNIVRLRMNLYAHVAEWKAGLDLFVKAYPEYFEPENSNVYNVAGCGAYSSWEGELDTVKLRKMAFGFNWRAGFDFPYMGLFLPEVSDENERWERFHQEGVKVGDGYTSVNEMETYMRNMKNQGFNVLCYFNLTEVGNHIVYPIPPRKAKKDKDLWKDPNDFLYYTDVREALVKEADVADSSPLYSNWEGCVVVDPGISSYKQHLLNQAKLHIKWLPSSAGLCIDRLDWLRSYNFNGDDQTSWKNNSPSRSLLLSWQDVMSELGPLMHRNEKVIFANVLYSRIDVMQYIDAIYDEYGQVPYALNRSAFLTLRKPLVAWTVSAADISVDPDNYFQRHLYLGAFLTVPYPKNDHTIRPDAEAEKYYLDYGEMLHAFKGRRWVLTPETFKIEKGKCKANLFETDSTYIMPIVFGGNEDVIISLSELPIDHSSCQILYPGGESRKMEAVYQEQRLNFSIPLKRGCGMLILKKV